MRSIVTKLLLFALAVSGLAVSVLGGSGAEAVPVPQQKCAFDAESTFSTSPDGIPGMSVSINNGDTARKAIVHFSGDIAMTGPAAISYSVDGGTAREDFYGPGALGATNVLEARSVDAVIPLARGTHTVTAMWRVTDSGDSANIDSRCLTIEARTR